ncbi:MAG TPA: hypothetical protein VM120_13475 [Bryobacteraceae bacterium]|nr:hypothetical protein [Bryobacteraceae bacterium]
MNIGAARGTSYLPAGTRCSLPNAEPVSDVAQRAAERRAAILEDTLGELLRSFICRRLRLLRGSFAAARKQGRGRHHA